MVQLPADFFNEAVQKKYEKYYRSLLLPYDNLDDFMTSTIQGINFPGFKSTLLTQVNPLGKIQERQSAKPIEDQFERSLKFLKRNYIDNYFFHSGTDEEFFNDDIWEFLYSKKKKGLIENLCLSLKHDLVKKNSLKSL